MTFISSVGRMTVSVGVRVALIRGAVYYNFFLDRFIVGFTVGAIK